MANATHASAPGAAIWEDFIDIFYAPASVFRRRQNGSVFVPLLAVTLLTGTIFYLNSGALRPLFESEFDRNMAAAMRQNPGLPADAVENMRSVAWRVGQVAVFVFTPMAVLCIGFATWLVGKLFEATQSFHAAFIVSAYAFVPRILEGVVNGIQGLLLDPASLDGRFRISLGPGRWLDPDTVSPLVIACVGRLDVFTLWITLLISIGLSVTGGIPLRRAAVAAAIIWVVGGLPLILQALRAM
jgi:hypothetical protein